MQREIKFRGLCVRTKNWVYGYLSNYDVINTDNGRLKVIPESVGQFTGLHDKNGVEIYEGDKLNHVWDSGIKVEHTNSVVIYDSCSFVCDDGKRYNFILSQHCMNERAIVSVAGNIHEREANNG